MQVVFVSLDYLRVRTHTTFLTINPPPRLPVFPCARRPDRRPPVQALVREPLRRDHRPQEGQEGGPGRRRGEETVGAAKYSVCVRSRRPRSERILFVV